MSDKYILIEDTNDDDYNLVKQQSRERRVRVQCRECNTVFTYCITEGPIICPECKGSNPLSKSLLQYLGENEIAR